MSDENRRTGRTTRIVDAAIQELFKTGKCTVVDHFGGTHLEARRASMRAFEIVIDRLYREHDFQFVIENKLAVIEPKDCTITLIKSTLTDPPFHPTCKAIELYPKSLTDNEPII